MESALPVSLLVDPTDGRALGRRTRSRILSFWLKLKKKENKCSVEDEKVM